MTSRRWGENTRAWAYRYLVLRDGEACAICHSTPTIHNSTTQIPTSHIKLDIDHVDGNFNNDDPDNLRLLCRHCNVSVSNTTRPRRSLSTVKREREIKEGKSATRIARLDCPYREGSPEMQANLLYEVPFRRWLMENISTVGSHDKHTAIAEGAELFGCSTLTTTRYLAKLLSPAGPLIQQPDALGHQVLLMKPSLRTNDPSPHPMKPPHPK